MAILKKLVLPCLGLSLIGGCAWIEIADVERQSNEGTAYDRGLYDGYLELSRKEYANWDFSDQHRFANRAREAAAGNRFEPEEISFRRLSDAHAAELGPARDRLMAALANGAAETNPKETARAQVNFDCWMEEAEENDEEGIAQCRGGFMEAVQLAEAAPPQAQMAKAEEEMPELPGPYYVMFGFDSAQIDDKADALLDKVVELWDRAKAKRIVLTGHTDLSGSRDYNLALSERRAEIVAMTLIDRGFPARDIAIRARGQEEPVVQTADGERSELNRRVEISFER